MEKMFHMSLSLNVLNHLGINLYSNIPAVLSEIVANSWDADATVVKITIGNDNIVIEDDGCGMDATDINNKFLCVGHRKRIQSTISQKFGRKYMGRKGIGKLSMFSIANEIEVYSKKNNSDGSYEINGFRMETKAIEDVIAGENGSDTPKCYYPEVLSVSGNAILNTGTKIVLKSLKKNTTSLTEEYIKKRVARRFGIIGSDNNFQVFVNDKEVSIEDRDYFHKLSYIWYFGQESEHYANAATKVVHKEQLNNEIIHGEKQYKITGWIGSVDCSGDLKDGNENLNKIVILVRGKLGQEDILAEYSEGGLYSKYLIGEINADFFDDDDQDDMATSNRQEYRQDDERFIALREFVYNSLKVIQSKWTELRNESGEKKAISMLPVIQEWVSSLQGDDRNYAKKMFGKINQTIVDDEKKKEILKYSILAFEKLRYSHHLSKIDSISAEDFEVFHEIFIGLDEIEATLYYQIIKERMEIIKAFQHITDANALEKVIQKYLFNHLWLLDPSWERVQGTEYIETTVLNALNATCSSLTDDERRGRLDLGYRQTAGKHIVIELKRADRIVTTSEVTSQISKYSDALEKVLGEMCGSNYAYEILFVIGKPIDNDTREIKREKTANALAAYNARIIYYKELIENASKAYTEYIAANKQSQQIIELFSMLETDD